MAQSAFPSGRLALVLGVLAIAAIAGMAACDSSSLAPSPAAVGAGTEAKPGGASAYQLNLSHIECTDNALEIHFVLLHVPKGIALDALTVNYTGTPSGSVQAVKNVGNVYHFTIRYDDWSGDVNITGASVSVPASGGNPARVVPLHNPGAYAGFYDCANLETLCAYELPADLSGSLFCTDRPLGNQINECAFIHPTSAPTGGQVGGFATVIADQSADVALVKDGSVGCDPGDQAYRIYLNVRPGDVLAKPQDASGVGGNISHITYCSCPVTGGN